MPTTPELSKLKYVNSDSLPSSVGIGPDKRPVYLKDSPVKRVSAPSCVGMLPVSFAKLNDNVVKRVSRPNCVGMVPTMLLPLPAIDRPSMRVSRPNCVGIVPDMLAASMWKIDSIDNSPSSVGMVPTQEDVSEFDSLVVVLLLKGVLDTHGQTKV